MGGDGGDGGDGGSGGIGDGGEGSIGDSGEGNESGNTSDSLGANVGGFTASESAANAAQDAAQDAEMGEGPSIGQSALSAQTDAAAAMAALSSQYGMVGVNLADPNSPNLASPQAAINDAFGQLGFAPTTTAQQDEAATYGYMSNLGNFNLPTAAAPAAVPADTAPTAAELGTPTAPPSMTDEEAQTAQSNLGLFGIAVPAPPAPSPYGQIASFQGPVSSAMAPATGPGHSAIGSDAVTGFDAADSAQTQAAIDAAVAQQAIDAANLNAQLNPPSPTVPTSVVAPENQPTAQIPGSFPAVPASLTAPPAEAPSLGEQGKAALAAAMNNALGQFGPPAPPAAPPAETPSPTIGQITGFTAPPGPPSMQGFAPPAIPGNLGLNLPDTPPAPPPAPVAALPGPATSIGTPAVAANFQGFSQSPSTGFTGLGVDTESGKSFSPQDPDNPTMPDPAALSRPAPISEETLPFPEPLSPQIAVPLPQARPDNLGKTATMNPAELGWAFNPNPTAVPNLPSLPSLNPEAPAQQADIDAAQAQVDAMIAQAKEALAATTPPSQNTLSPADAAIPAPLSNTAIPGSYPSLPATLGPPAAHSQITGQTSPTAQAQSAANLAAQAQAAAQAALAATQAAQSGHTFGAPASGVVGPQSSNQGTLGTGISGFSPGSNLASIANIAQANTVAEETDTPVTAVTAMQALFSIPMSRAA